MRSLEDRMQAVEQKVRGAADTSRARTAPENPMVTSMRAAVTKAEEQLAKAEAAGDTRRIEEAKANLATRREWLAEAEKSARREPTASGLQQPPVTAASGSGAADLRHAEQDARRRRPDARLAGVARAGAAVREQGAVGDQEVRLGVGHDRLDDVAGPDAVGRREVHEPAVAGPAGEPAGRGVLAALPRRDQQLDPRGRPAPGSPPS